MDSQDREILHLAQRDSRDALTVQLLTKSASIAPKLNRVAFIGTGNVNENVLHTYIEFVRNRVNYQNSALVEVLYVCRTQVEYDYLKNWGVPCVLWQYQTRLVQWLLSTKMVVLSSHLFRLPGDCLLSAAVSGAIKCQLWHGLPAKNIGFDAMYNASSDDWEGGDIHFGAALFEDVLATDYLFVQTENEELIAHYQAGFPNAKIPATGDARMDLIFDTEYCAQFRANKFDANMHRWLLSVGERRVILYCPTFRDGDVAQSEQVIRRATDWIGQLDASRYRVVVKLHPAFDTVDAHAELLHAAQAAGHMVVANNDEVYTLFERADMLITDYSSIKVDFIPTKKPIVLWRGDQGDYARMRNFDTLELMQRVNEVCHIHGRMDLNTSDIDQYMNEPEEWTAQREALIPELFPYRAEGHRNRTVKKLLEILHNEMSGDATAPNLEIG